MRTDRGDDLDTIILTAIMRRHKYGKALMKEYLKLESIRYVTGVEDWSMQDLLDLLPEKQRSWAPAIEPAPPSGLRMQPTELRDCRSGRVRRQRPSLLR
ncbi:hypothetical protein AB1Y20_001113 [Prymnesium parvum]|uniref:Uncharacterized protein n=1 Tax=Prymnesium parvum TaxID=97485 RepID=A0AB34K9Y7_PRYPA